MSGVSDMRIVVECSAELAKRFDELESRLAFRPGWIAGYVNLGRYIGKSDKKGRVAKAWSQAEGLKPKMINGVPHFALADVDRAMRNGRDVEVAV
jgi:phage regulator Rha-like protein